MNAGFAVEQQVQTLKDLYSPQSDDMFKTYDLASDTFISVGHRKETGGDAEFRRVIREATTMGMPVLAPGSIVDSFHESLVNISDYPDIPLMLHALRVPDGYCAFEKPIPLMGRNKMEIARLTGFIWGTTLIAQSSTFAPTGWTQEEVEERNNNRHIPFRVPEAPGFQAVVAVAGVLATKKSPGCQLMMSDYFPYLSSYAEWDRHCRNRGKTLNEGSPHTAYGQALTPEQVPVYLLHMLGIRWAAGWWKLVPDAIESPNLERLAVALKELPQGIQRRETNAFTWSGGLMNFRDILTRGAYVIKDYSPLIF